MNFKFLLYLSLIFFLNNLFSQNTVSINGKLTDAKAPILDAIIELNVNKISKFAVSDKNGNYKFINIVSSITDTINLKVNQTGYKSFTKRLNNLQKINIVDILLETESPEILKEIVVNAKDKTIITAKKSSYKIDQKDFIKNAKAPEVLSTIPNVFQSNDKIIVDGKLEGKVFIDGLETMANELKSIDAADIDRVEVINNPSGAYGTDFLGAVINIISKKKTEEFIKGSIGLSGGLRNNNFGITPSLSYKKGKITFKSNFDYKRNNQIVDYSSNRIDSNGSFFQSNVNDSKGTQIYFQSRLNIEFNEKTNFNITGFLSSYKFIANVNGFSSLNNSSPDLFLKEGEDYKGQWNIASVYKYEFKKSKNLYFKNAFTTYDSRDISKFNFNNGSSNYFNIQSKNKEFSSSLNYEYEEFMILKIPTAVYVDLKYINRNFSFSNTNYFINQNIINGTIEFDSDWSEKFSTVTAITLENTNNNNLFTKQNYSLILPTFNALYHFDKKVDARFGYSRKVLRPNVSDLNDAIIILNPGIAKQGNSNLDPQIRNYYSFSINKAFKSDNFSLKFYNESINNAISEIYQTQGNLLIQTLGNAAKFNSTGFTAGVRTKLFKKVNLNLNSGFDYNIFEDNNPLALIKNNRGYTFVGNINLSTKFFKDKFSVSFSARQDGPKYSLLSKRITYPYLDLSISTNLLKDKLAVSLYGRGLLGNSKNGFIDISSLDNFYQRIETQNTFSNLLLTLTYYFGKKFSDKIDDNNIQNEDIRR
jgi:Outer membrane protein beta-barrel family